MGVMKAKSGGVWVPVGSDGPHGPQGPIGSAGPSVSPVKTKGRAYTCSLLRSAASNGQLQSIPVQTVNLNDGFSGSSGAPGPTLATTGGALPGRFRVAMHITIGSGTPGNWMILRIQHGNGKGTVFGNYDTVAANSWSGARVGSVWCVIDMAPGDNLWPYLQTDVAGALVDGRSWLTVAEVAW